MGEGRKRGMREERGTELGMRGEGLCGREGWGKVKMSKAWYGWISFLIAVPLSLLNC